MPFELPAEIASTIPAEHLSHASVQKYNSPAELIKGHLELQSHLGRSIVMPNGESKPEDWDKWSGETSAKLKDHGYHVAKLSDLPPEKPDAYELKMDGFPDEIVKDHEAIKKFKEVAHRQGLSQAKAQALLNDYIKDIVPLAPKQADAPALYTEQDVSQIHEKHLGADAAVRKQEAQAFFKNLAVMFPEAAGLYDIFEEASSEFEGKYLAISAHPKVTKILSELNRAFFSQDFGGNLSGNAPLSDNAQEAHNKAVDIMRNPDNPKHKRYWAGEKLIADEVEALMKQAHPGETTL